MSKKKKKIIWKIQGKKKRRKNLDGIGKKENRNNFQKMEIRIDNRQKDYAWKRKRGRSKKLLEKKYKI